MSNSFTAFRAIAAIALAALTIGTSYAEQIYFDNFDATLGSEFPEWTFSIIRYKSAADPPGAGEIAAEPVTNVESPNRAQRFLGEFGGPKIGTPADPGFNRTQVDETVTLLLRELPPHLGVRVTCDLYVLKSWDGNSPQFGPDRLKIAVADGPTLLDASFSNNHKVERQGSFQDYPKPNSAPQTAAASTNTLAYDFFGDAIYRCEFIFPHRADTLELNFTSSLFEGKGTGDESWGLDNVRVETTKYAPH